MAENFYNKYQYDFSEGVNQAVGRLLMGDSECNKIENGELEKIGGVKKTRGYSQRGSDVATGYDILGLCSAYKSDGTMKQIAVANGASNSDAYTYNPINNSWTAHHLSLTTGAKAEFEYFLDGFFMVNFSDATRFNDYTQWYTTTNVTNAPKAKYIKLYNSRIYLAYVDDGTAYPSRVVYSDLPESGEIAWDNAENYFDVDSDDGDVIKGLAVNANRLLVFKEKALYRYDTNTLYKVPGCPGTVSQRSVKDLFGKTIYLHSSGIWSYDGTSSTLVSRRIKDIIAGISTKNLTNACAWTSGDHYYLYVGDIDDPVSGLQIDNCLIDYDVAKNAFSWRSIEKDITVFETYRDDRSGTTYDDATVTYDDADTTYDGLLSSEERVYFGATDGAVYRFNYGNDHDGADISFKIETRDLYLDSPSQHKLLQKIHIFTDKGQGSLVVQYRADGGDWKTLGKVDGEQTELIFQAGQRCRKIRLRFLESSSGDQFTVEGFDIYYSLEGLIE